MVGGGYTYYPTGNLAETSVIDIDDGSNVVAAPFNTLRYDFVMINLHGMVVAFGGWNKAAVLGGLQDFEVWSPNLQMWAQGSDVFGAERSYFAMLTLSFPKGSCDLGRTYEEWISEYVKVQLDNTILTAGGII